MDDLKKRFGRLVAVHRRRKGLTQEGLAEAAGISIDMISKIEIGATGARFPSIERLAGALQVDPAELFSPNIPSGALQRGEYLALSIKLAELSPADLQWVAGIVSAALQSRGASSKP